MEVIYAKFHNFIVIRYASYVTLEELGLFSYEQVIKATA